jgi:hypothetical protein
VEGGRGFSSGQAFAGLILSLDRFLNGIKLQIWATWLMYAVLVDLSDAVAEAVQLPLERISMEMVLRGFTSFQYNQGKSTDPIAYYLAAPENRGLGVVKTLRNHLKSLI